jgi:putative ABC transport system substrate-binding protein
MMKRTALNLSIFLFATLILAWVNIAEAQQAGKVYRIGFLRFSPRPPTGATHVAFRQRMRELGYVEGQNLVIEYRSAKGKRERRLEMAAELVRLKVDVIVVSPAPPMIRAAQKATETIPILMAGVYVDPVEAGFVDSFARPGGNITGITNFESELHGKRLELLKEAFPRISRVAIIWPRYQQRPGMKGFEAAAQALGIQIQSLVIGRRLDQLKSAFSAISRERTDALIVASMASILRHNAQIIEFTAKERLPTMYARRRFVKEGGLMSYGANLPDMFRQTATYVDKILKGAKPADLPVERPTKFELVINLKTAKQIGATIPPEMLFRADKVIK